MLVSNLRKICLNIQFVQVVEVVVGVVVVVVVVWCNIFCTSV